MKFFTLISFFLWFLTKIKFWYLLISNILSANKFEFIIFSFGTRYLNKDGENYISIILGYTF